MYVYLFILLFSGDVECGHLALHSFPTRRSSDLLTACALFSTGLFFTLRSLLKLTAYRLVTAFGLSALDRKSTRLNSSHLVISYAVFCLKKKKIYRAKKDSH